jgi:hypothetical protein
MATLTFPHTWIRSLCLVLTSFLLLFSTPVAAQTTFPFPDRDQLTQEELQIQRYKLQRLRITRERDRWYIIRGINENIEDMTLLKLVGRTQQLETIEQGRMIGTSITIGGLALMVGGGLMLANVIQFNNSSLVGVGLIVSGGAMAVYGELSAGNIGDTYSHILDQREAEGYVKEYNDQLKKQLGLEHLQSLE